jgi:hypothetical protein
VPIQCLFSPQGPDCDKAIGDKTAEANVGPLAKWLRENMDYSNGNNLFGAPYDWRHSPDSGVSQNFFLKQNCYYKKHSFGK